MPAPVPGPVEDGVLVLGPPRLASGGTAVPVGSPRETVVLSVLALSAGSPVPAARLAEAVWDEDPPATARTQLQICVSGLRRRLAALALPVTIATAREGYQLDVTDDSLDLRRFTTAAARARALERAGDLDGADASWSAALGQWRGPALDGVPSPLVGRAALALDRQRAEAVAARASVRLRLGRHQEVAAELTPLVAERPLDEELRGLLMRALIAGRRRTEALEVYRTGRRVLADELGLEPGAALRELHARALEGTAAAGDDRVPAPLPPVLPRQLPAAPATVVGRAAELSRVVDLLAGPPDPRTSFSVRVVVVHGAGGVGKSTLVLRAAHELAAGYPDGQLYADLHQEPGGGPGVRATRVLGRFLRALGMADALVPDDAAERAAAYRSRLASRRVLVVLDGVTDPADVTALLPGSPGSAVLVTSRTRLAGAPGTARVGLGVLADESGLALLAAQVGDDRVAQEPEAARRLVTACDGLPLALTIAGARLASRPHWRLADLVERLQDEGSRLDELSIGELRLRSTLELTHHGLTPDARRLFRLLAQPAFPRLPLWAAGALLGDERRGDDALSGLLEAHLVTTRAGAAGPRTVLHDLVRVFAAEQHAPADSGEAVERLLHGWLALAGAAWLPAFGDRLLPGPLPGRWTPSRRVLEEVAHDPLPWVDEERASLVAAVSTALSAGRPRLAWRLGLAAAALFEVRGHVDDWRATVDPTQEAADTDGDPTGRALTRLSRGALLVHQGELEEAGSVLDAALDLFDGTGHGHGSGACLRQLAVVHRVCGRPSAARAAASRAVALLHAAGDRSGEAQARAEVARLDVLDGDVATARDTLAEALRLARAAAMPRTEAQVLYRAADVAALGGDAEQAVRDTTRVLEIATSLGDRIGVGYALYGLGRHEAARGRRAAAADRFRAAVATAEVTGDSHLLERARRRLAAVSEPAVVTEPSAGPIADR